MTRNKQISIVVFEIVSILMILLEATFEDNNINGWILALAGILCLGQIAFITWNQRSNPLLFAICFFMAYFVYSVVAKVYFEVDCMPYIFRFTSVTKKELLRDAEIVQLFFCIFAFSIKEEIKIDWHIFEKGTRCNNYIVWICCVACVCAPFLFYSASNGYGVRGSISSPLYEYTCLFLLLGLMYSGREKCYLILLLISSGFWCLHGIIYGERAPALTVVIIWGCYLLLPKITSKRIFLYSIIGIIAFSLVGAFRGLSFFTFEGFQKSLSLLLDERFTSDTAYYAYQAGNAIVRFESCNSIWDRVRYGAGYLEYIFVGGSVAAGNLANIVQKNPGTFHQGGGWIMFYAHFWGGVIGVILLGSYIVFIARHVVKLVDSNDYFKNYLALYVTASVPRWFLYSPSQITRGIFIYALLYGVFISIHKLTTRKISIP